MTSVESPMPAHAVATEVLVIGCGNILRGDDAAGPVLVRRLWERGLPPQVRCADGGTGGMDVAFQMRGIPHVILVDAARSGAKPGTLFELPGSEVEQTPPLAGINLHAFRWDHALAFARWLLKEDYPRHITVYLIEGENFDVGAGLSSAVDRSLERLADRLLASWQSVPADPSSTPATTTNPEYQLGPSEVHLDFDADGYLRIEQTVAASFFPADVLVPLWRNGRLLLLPTRGAAAGGLLLKQRNAAGDRCVLLSELFQFQMPVGRFVATWHEELGGLEVHLKGS